MKTTYVYSEEKGVESIDRLICRDFRVGWYPAREDGMARALTLLEQIPFLKLKDGFVLKETCARWFDGKRIFTWAVPEGEETEEREMVPFDDMFLPVPGMLEQSEGCETPLIGKPKGALPPMEAIEGDDSPESYLAASLFARELVDMGGAALGRSSMRWMFHNVLLRNIWSDSSMYMSAIGPRECWEIEEIPAVWPPMVVTSDEWVKVTMHTYMAWRGRAIYEIKDTYRRGSYDLTWESGKLAHRRDRRWS